MINFLKQHIDKSVKEVIKLLEIRDEERMAKQNLLIDFKKQQKGKYFKIIHHNGCVTFVYVINESLHTKEIKITKKSYIQGNGYINYLWFDIPQIKQLSSGSKIVKSSKEEYQKVYSISEQFKNYLP